jgi:polyhydroxyalkanoate synthase
VQNNFRFKEILMTAVPPSGFDPAAAMQALQALWQNIGHTPGAQAAMPGQFAPLGEAFGIAPEPLQELQKQWTARHTALWQKMVADAQGQGDVAASSSADRRFADPAWHESPLYRYLHQAYLVNAEALAQLPEIAPAQSEQKRQQLRYVTRQFIDAMAPSNFVATNPEFIKTAIETQGESIRRGIENMLTDLERGHISMTDEAAFEVGRNLAATRGSVVFENELIQLIQYAPTTKTVAKRPFLIVPPCINKFYILDLQPENSFVRHVVEQGNTVFLVSWRNVQADQGHLTWEDYLELGPLTALQVVQEITGEPQVNALGFCVGGTILSAALAVARSRGEDPVASLTLLTTLLDFSDTGEIGCLVDEASVSMRESTIGEGGLLRGSELASVFSSLRANDLIWQYVVGNYLKGNTPPPFDLLYWNSDATNLPGPFLAWYLRNLYLENNLRDPGQLTMFGEPADLSMIDMPVFIYASREDHIVPWKSSYLSRDLVSGETTFVLGASGHIAGVINPPAKNKRSYWFNDENPVKADDWLAGADEVKGSWWPTWSEWLTRFKGGTRAAPKTLGNGQYQPLEPAPGRYVKQKA